MCLNQQTQRALDRRFLSFWNVVGRHRHSARLGKVLVREERSTIVWRRSAGVQKGPWHSQGERTHRRAGESCVDSKAVGLHGLVLTDKASLNGQPLRRRSTTLSFKTCAGIATSAACALVLMFRAVSETRHAVWLLFCWLIAVVARGGPQRFCFGRQWLFFRAFGAVRLLALRW